MEVFVTQGGIRLRYHQLHEAADPILFIHGLGCASSSDYPMVVASSFYPESTSMLLDLAGAGFSDKPADADYSADAQVGLLMEFINHWPDKTFTLYGHSAGALVALKLAEQAGDKVESLILCEPGINQYGEAFLSGIVSMPMQTFIATGFKEKLNEMDDGTNDVWLGSFSVCSPYAIYQWAESVLKDNRALWMERLKTLKTPRKAIILSEKSAIKDLPIFSELGCVVECVSSSSHMIMHENPGGLALAISKIFSAWKCE